MTKIIFESENPSDITGKESPVKRKLKNHDLNINDIATNTKLYSAKCEAVCEVKFNNF